jgi:LAGLIDADG endonuclease
MLQLNKLCVKYALDFKEPLDLTFNNGWLSGFIDSDGSIYLNEKSGQIFISITQKNKYLLDPLQNIYGGKVAILSPKIDAFKYSIYRKNELFYLMDNYFSKYPLRTAKAARLSLIKDFYLLRPYRNPNADNLIEFNKWVTFLDNWEKYRN